MSLKQFYILQTSNDIEVLEDYNKATEKLFKLRREGVEVKLLLSSEVNNVKFNLTNGGKQLD